MLHNDEINAVVHGPEFGALMEKSFDHDLCQSKQILPQEWDETSFGASRAVPFQPAGFLAVIAPAYFGNLKGSPCRRFGPPLDGI